MVDIQDKVVEVDVTVHEARIEHGVGRLFLSAPPEIRAARAGQYVMIRSLRAGGPLLGRPLTILHSGGHLELMYNIVGEGTRHLSTTLPGEVVQLVGPLGRPFALPDTEVTIIGDAGHVGTTLSLARERGEAKRPTRVIFTGTPDAAGVYPAAIHFLVGEFEATGATVDLVDERTIAEAVETARPALIAAGASDGIMAKVQAVADRLAIPGFVALQAPMACGVGVCQACVRHFRDGAMRIICETPIVDLAAPVFAEGGRHG
ncbi:hypothetical protein L1787_23055 [Acuticoccus sp. M5D2P5]|uniref:hypothetical protein n=1 Tax=Acuticoccus kalidii TaxID=2910977 RepID=UPI001F2F9876|nr:hypothetical protein [Acuticoccus kalidii]MCF3936276.1 hypothetical protein [Acuticoccus kalidii]